jgi:hypothetical protein
MFWDHPAQGHARCPLGLSEGSTRQMILHLHQWQVGLQEVRQSEQTERP